MKQPLQLNCIGSLRMSGKNLRSTEVKKTYGMVVSLLQKSHRFTSDNLQTLRRHFFLIIDNSFDSLQTNSILHMQFWHRKAQLSSMMPQCSKILPQRHTDTFV